MVSTMAKSMGSVSILRMNAPSIFRKSMGRLRRYANDDMPLPKSSSAMGQPIARSRAISSEAWGEIGHRGRFGQFEAQMYPTEVAAS